MRTPEGIAANQKQFRIAIKNAKKILKPNNHLHVTKCPGTNRTITFAG